MGQNRFVENTETVTAHCHCCCCSCCLRQQLQPMPMSANKCSCSSLNKAPSAHLALISAAVPTDYLFLEAYSSCGCTPSVPALGLGLRSSLGFYARQHICYSAYMPRQFRLSVCLSHVCIVSKRLNISSKFFHHLIGPSF